MASNNSYFSGLRDDVYDFAETTLFGKNANTSALMDAGKSVPKAPDNNPKEDLAIAQTAADNAANSNYSNQVSAARVGAQLNQQSYAQKAQTDYNTAVNTANATKNITGSGSATFVTDNTKRDIFGRNMADVANQGFSQEMQREQFQQGLASADRSRQNQQLLANTDYQNQSALQRAQQASTQELAKIQANAQVTAAGLGAQSSILGSLFGSVGGGSANYRYWN